jgi:hypothetical protein
MGYAMAPLNRQTLPAFVVTGLYLTLGLSISDAQGCRFQAPQDGKNATCSAESSTGSCWPLDAGKDVGKGEGTCKVLGDDECVCTPGTPDTTLPPTPAPAGPRFNLTTFPGVGPAVVSEPVFINLYPQNFNATAPANENSFVLDNFTSSIIASDYFAKAASNYGVGTPTFGGSVTTIASCQIPNLPNPANSDLAAYVACNAQAGSFPAVTGRNWVVNVFLAPTVVPKEFFTITVMLDGITESDTLVDEQPCHGYSGYHFAVTPLDQYLGVIPFTVVPTDTQCNNTLGALTGELSHEMVEVITDVVYPFGWAHHTTIGLDLPSDFGSPNFELDLKNLAPDASTGEAGDVCSSIGPKPVSSDAIPFLASACGAITGPCPPDTNLQFYWSNSDQACEPAFTSDTLPQIMSAGWGWSGALGSFALTINGQNFGSLPPAFASPSAIGPSPYFEWKDAATNFDTGSSIHLPQGGVAGLRFPSWRDKLIVVGVPDSVLYNSNNQSTLHVCDSSQISVWRPSNGQRSDFTFAIPGPSELAIHSLQALGTIGDSEPFQVDVLDASQSLVVSAVPVSVTITGQSSQTFTAQSVSSAFTPRFSGVYTLIASANTCSGTAVSSPPATTRVPPGIFTPGSIFVSPINPSGGALEGGTIVTITGAGFSGTPGTTKVTFGGSSATVFSVDSDSQITATTPASKSAGPVRVVVTANGVSSNEALFDQWPVFNYYPNDIPVVTAVVGCGTDLLTATIYGTTEKNGVPQFGPLSGALLIWNINNNGGLRYQQTTTSGEGTSINFAAAGPLTSSTSVTVTLSGATNGGTTISIPVPLRICGFPIAGPDVPEGTNGPSLSNFHPTCLIDCGQKHGSHPCLACEPVDVSGDLRQKVGDLVQLGVLSPNSDRRFRPSDKAPLSDFVRSLGLLTGFKQVSRNGLGSNLLSLPNQDLASETAIHMVAISLQMNDRQGRLLCGLPEKRESMLVTRGQMAEILWRVAAFIAVAPRTH